MDDILQMVLSAIKNLLILILSAGFLGIGMLKIVDFQAISNYFLNWGFPLWTKYIVGVIEIVIAIGIFYQPTRVKASICSVILMFGALLIHIYFKEIDMLLPPILITLGAISLIFIERFLDKSFTIGSN